jgi:hypothetical protein
MRRNRWQKLIREIRLHELVKLIPDDETIVIFNESAEAGGFREEDALFSGTVEEFWKDKTVLKEFQKVYVAGVQSSYLDDFIGTAVMIVVY